MTPRLKAENLVEMFMNIEPTKLSDYSRIYHPTAKQFSLIVVNEVISVIENGNPIETQWNYWQNVKQEIEKL